MTKQEIYKILRYKPEFVKNMYFPYAWLVIEEADFAVPLEEKRLYINKDNEKTVNLYKLARATSHVTLEVNSENEVVVKYEEPDVTSTLRHLSHIIGLLLDTYTDSFKFLSEHKELLFLTEIPYVFSKFLTHCLALKEELLIKFDEDIPSWRERIILLLQEYK